MLSVSIECSSLQRSVCSSNVNGAQHETALLSVGGRVGLRSVTVILCDNVIAANLFYVPHLDDPPQPFCPTRAFLRALLSLFHDQP